MAVFSIWYNARWMDFVGRIVDDQKPSPLEARKRINIPFKPERKKKERKKEKRNK